MKEGWWIDDASPQREPATLRTEGPF